MVVIEALGDRTQIGDIKFTKIEGYQGVCAEMDDDEAKSLLRGEEYKKSIGKEVGFAVAKKVPGRKKVTKEDK